jgi:aminopeptidase N
MLLPLLLALVTPQDAPRLTSGRPMPPEQACYDVWQYTLSLSIDPEKRAIQGTVEVYAKILESSDEIVLDLDSGLTVDSVVMRDPGVCDIGDDRPVPFTHRDGEIRIQAPELLRKDDSSKERYFAATVAYHGQPREAPRAPWDGGFVWAKTPSGAHWIATANQMQGADLWWPCKDQPDDEADSVVINVTVPKPLVCASNGQLFGVYDAESTRTFTWHVTTPINTYGIALNIAPYETISRDYTSIAGDTFPVTYWVLPENLAKGKVLFEDILKQMRGLEELFGPYPFRADKYGVAETPHLGMEHQTIIAYGNGYRNDLWGEDRGYDELHLHEFAHEWWANLVTAKNWNDFWIHEGFASYAQALYAERVAGETAYFTEMQEQRRHANRAAIAPREPRSTAEMYFGDVPGSPGGDIYAKGAWVLHSLRWLVGDEPFFRALRRMAYPDPALEQTTDGSACRFATTDEILALAEEHTGEELDWFFEVYLRGAELPVLAWEQQGDELVLAWTAPNGKPFPMPVEVRLGDQYVRVPCPDGKGRLQLGGRAFAVDPRERALRANRE